MTKPTIEKILEMGWKTLDGWAIWRDEKVVKHFEKIMNSLDLHRPAPEIGIIAFYDFYKENKDEYTRYFGNNIRDVLFVLLEIEPKMNNCCIRLFVDEKYQHKSLKESTKRMDEIVDKMKHPEQENKVSMNP